MQSSLRVCSAEAMKVTQATTDFLKMFYKEHHSFKQCLKQIATSLRAEKLMVIKKSVLQTLKTASLFLWCAAFISNRNEFDGRNCTSTDIWKFLALFNAGDHAVQVNLQTFQIQIVHRSTFFQKDALVIVQVYEDGVRNSAQRITEASLAAIQRFCCSKSKQENVLSRNISNHQLFGS